MDRTGLARAYYDCLDGHDYERLASILADGFVHDRPDRTLDGRERFVRFMREERPDRDTTHDVERVYRSAEGVAVTGRLYASDGALMTAFLDAFAFTAGSGEQEGTRTAAAHGGRGPVIRAITTYSLVDEAPDPIARSSEDDDPA